MVYQTTFPARILCMKLDATLDNMDWECMSTCSEAGESQVSDSPFPARVHCWDLEEILETIDWDRASNCSEDSEGDECEREDSTAGRESLLMSKSDCKSNRRESDVGAEPESNCHGDFLTVRRSAFPDRVRCLDLSATLQGIDWDSMGNYSDDDNEEETCNNVWNGSTLLKISQMQNLMWA